jgi:hypothetical protein
MRQPLFYKKIKYRIMNIIELDGKRYNFRFTLKGLKEGQKSAFIRAQKAEKEGYSEMDDLIENAYYFLKECNRNKTEETERFTMALAAFWDIVDKDYELFMDITDITKEVTK